jgi:hypothetical protein
MLCTVKRTPSIKIGEERLRFLVPDGNVWYLLVPRTTEVHNRPPVSSCKNKEGEHRRKFLPALADYWLAGTLALSSERLLQFFHYS